MRWVERPLSFDRIAAIREVVHILRYVRKEDLEAGPVEYNFEMQKGTMEELHGESMFFKDTDGTIYHTYSSYARAGEELAGTYRFLDLAPLGRNEGPDGNMMKWMRRHDEYGT